MPTNWTWCIFQRAATKFAVIKKEVNKLDSIWYVKCLFASWNSDSSALLMKENIPRQRMLALYFSLTVNLNETFLSSCGLKKLLIQNDQWELKKLCLKSQVLQSRCTHTHNIWSKTEVNVAGKLKETETNNFQLVFVIK